MHKDERVQSKKKSDVTHSKTLYLSDIAIFPTTKNYNSIILPTWLINAYLCKCKSKSTHKLKLQFVMFSYLLCYNMICLSSQLFGKKWQCLNLCPVDTDVSKTSSGRLKKVTTSYEQTRPRHGVWKKTSDLRRLEDVWFTSSWRRPICDVLKTSNLQRLQEVWFTTSWRRTIYVVLKMSNLRRLENVWFMTSWRRL